LGFFPFLKESKYFFFAGAKQEKPLFSTNPHWLHRVFFLNPEKQRGKNDKVGGKTNNNFSPLGFLSPGNWGKKKRSKKKTVFFKTRNLFQQWGL